MKERLQSLDALRGFDMRCTFRDTFAVRAEGNRIYIAGRDDPEFDLARALRNRAGYGIFFTFERATRGVYHGAAKVRTTVAVKRTAERLEVGFSCEEPTMDIAC